MALLRSAACCRLARSQQPKLGCYTGQAATVIKSRLVATRSFADDEDTAPPVDVANMAANQPHRGDEEPLAAGLYIIATPIGNLQDITLRALSVLRRVTLVLAEDTRHSRKLLNHYGIRASMLSYHDHNEGFRQQQVLQRLQCGEAVGLVSDAGMPGISDPGYLIVRAAVEAGVRVVPIPGPCAFVAALVASGLSTESFLFCGFLPPKSGARQKQLQALASQPATLVFYAPPHGLAAVLADCAQVLGGSRRCCVARELTKVHEEMFRSTLAEAAKEFGEVREARGEICLVVEGAPQGAAAAINHPAQVERVLKDLLQEGTSVSAAVKEVVSSLGANRKAAYAAALRLSDELSNRMARGLQVRAQQGGQQQGEASKGEQQQQAMAKREEQPSSQLSQRSAGDFDFNIALPTPFRRMAENMFQMQREMDSLMGHFGMPSLLPADPFDLFDRGAAPLVARRAPLAPLTRLLPVEVTEDDKGFTVTAEVPGFDKKDIKVTLSDDGVLTIAGETQQETKEPAAGGEGKEGAAAPVVTSRRYASFKRIMALPDNVNHDGIKANTDKGVLTVHVPKVPMPEAKTKTKEIPVA